MIKPREQPKLLVGDMGSGLTTLGLISAMKYSNSLELKKEWEADIPVVDVRM